VREVAAYAANRESSLGAAAPRSSKPILLSFNELSVKFDSKLVVVTSIFAMMFVALAWRKRAASKATVSLSDENLESEKRSSFLMKTRVIEEESSKEEEKRTAQYFDLKSRFTLLLLFSEVLRDRVATMDVST